ncbi:MAG: type I-U CRISPR-associated protein Cas5/Cas6 [Bifidobacteriaceae bacterium]|jgi:CRISPR-associated protein Csb2|nr:type I-U CRISPR-associated protein Cas5/Cas6 [Bifidobacteriaceae bacterium]
MAFAIVATFPFGTYRGHTGQGEVDLFPSQARLHAALLAAAGSGTRAETAGQSTLRPCPADTAALEWIEENPSDGMVMPTRAQSRTDATAYRNLGLLKPKRTGIKQIGKQDLAGVALGGSVCWVWETDPPPDVRQSLEALCPDVPYLGQADSPVRLRVERAALPRLSHRRNPGARLGSRRPGSLDLAVPRRGRTAALSQLHDLEASAKVPTVSADASKTDERELTPAVCSSSLGIERFQSVDAQPAEGPWEWCWVVPFEASARITREQAVAFSVAFRKTLISHFDGDAPSLLTGRYAEGVAKPSNRLAIQIVSASACTAEPIPTRQAFVVAVPRSADPADVAVIGEALMAAETIRALGRAVRLSVDADRSALVDAAAFWRPPEDGLYRTWSVLPAVVETRAQGHNWSLADAVTLSIGLVWKDQLDQDHWSTARGSERYRLVLAAARAAGVRVLSVHSLPVSQVERFVHKTPEGLAPLPYQASVELGELEGAGTAFAAIGQSRHLGGGLLVPNDVPEDVAESWRLGS